MQQPYYVAAADVPASAFARAVESELFAYDAAGSMSLFSSRDCANQTRLRLVTSGDLLVAVVGFRIRAAQTGSFSMESKLFS